MNNCRVVTDIPESLRERLRALAKRNERSGIAELRVALIRHLEREEAETESA